MMVFVWMAVIIFIVIAFLRFSNNSESTEECKPPRKTRAVKSTNDLTGFEQRVQIDYTDSKGKFSDDRNIIIRTLKCDNKNNITHIVCVCELRKKIRTFAVVNIKELVDLKTGEVFSAKTEIKAYLDSLAAQV